MKKQLLTLAVLCAVAFTSNAQTEKGDNLIGGSISFTKDKRTPLNLNNSNSMESRIFSAVPSFGHFFSKNLAVGISAGFTSSKYTYESLFYNGTTTLTSNNINKNNSFNVGPLVRYYIDIVDKFKFFGQGSASVAFGKSVSVDGGSITVIPRSTSYKTTVYAAAVYPGFAFFPTKRWAFEFSFPLISYTKYKMKDNGNNVSSQAYQNEGFQFGLSSFNPSLGLNYHF